MGSKFDVCNNRRVKLPPRKSRAMTMLSTFLAYRAVTAEPPATYGFYFAQA